MVYLRTACQFLNSCIIITQVRLGLVVGFHWTLSSPAECTKVSLNPHCVPNFPEFVLQNALSHPMNNGLDFLKRKRFHTECTDDNEQEFQHPLDGLVVEVSMHSMQFASSKGNVLFQDFQEPVPASSTGENKANAISISR